MNSLLCKSTLNLRKILRICLRSFVNPQPDVYCYLSVNGITFMRHQSNQETFIVVAI